MQTALIVSYQSDRIIHTCTSRGYGEFCAIFKSRIFATRLTGAFIFSRYCSYYLERKLEYAKQQYRVSVQLRVFCTAGTGGDAGIVALTIISLQAVHNGADVVGSARSMANQVA